MANLTTSGTSGYPGSIDTSTTLVDGASGDEIIAENVNGPTAAAVNIETELGTLPKGSAADVKTRLNVSQNADGTIKSTVIAAATGTTVNYSAGIFKILPTLLRGYLTSATISAASGSATTTIESGLAVDSSSIDILSLSASIQKTTATWVVGSANGGLDAGAVAASTWYHWHLIKRTDTNVVDVLFSLSAASPTLPASYSVSRRIGSGKTNATGQWMAIYQNGREFFWLQPGALDVDANNPGTAAVTATINVPTGVRVKALMNAQYFTATSGGTQAMYVSSLDLTDVAPSGTATPLGSNGSGQNSAAGIEATTQVSAWTNTSAQVRYRISASAAGDLVKIVAVGWLDPAGM